MEENEEITEQTAEQTNSDPYDGLTYEDIVEATYEGYMKAYKEVKEEQEKAEEEKQKEEELKRETNFEQTHVFVDNLPEYQNVLVKNFNQFDYATLTDAVNQSNGVISPIEFSSSTDATMYTVSTAAQPTSVAEQQTLYTLEMRNILLIFLLAWFVVTLVRMIRNIGINFAKGRKS